MTDAAPQNDLLADFEDVGDLARWPMTPRTRFVLWCGAVLVAEQLRAVVATWTRVGRVDPAVLDCWHEQVVTQFPAQARLQPLAWWQDMAAAAARMHEALRTGVRWNPRTPAEEAALWLAAQNAVVILDWIRDGEEPFSTAVAALPAGADLAQDAQDAADCDDECDGDCDDECADEARVALGDYEFEDAMEALIGDVDIAMMFDPGMDGIGDPENEINQRYFIGDYRVANWHQPFPFYQRDPQMASCLF